MDDELKAFLDEGARLDYRTDAEIEEETEGPEDDWVAPKHKTGGRRMLQGRRSSRDNGRSREKGTKNASRGGRRSGE